MEALDSLLELQHDRLLQLQAILAKEKQAVLHKEADILLRLCGEKATLLDQIKTHDQNMAHHPKKNLLQSQPDLIHKLQLSKQLLAQCQQLNTENAHLVAFNQASLNRLSQALQVSRNASSLTYNDKGKTSTLSSLGNNIKV
ncbi:flagellar export chaperone FlgN [uncultured Shewanella sp.]|uniref:flagellar export chaperone FlgN n=1 Tax=uncultured Shewanella sp. TaxID=173975 RepID=UPI00260DAE34|nr:flagellar export chaperone FlgN [uncultured Shewanella sp.]